jgi:hypothetical protein
MKKILLLFTFFTAVNFFHAQTYSLIPGDTLVCNAPLSNISIFDIWQKNITQNTVITFKWTTISVNLPSQWGYSLCDKGTCYPGIPGSGTMDTVMPGGHGFLGLNIDPGTTPGSGVVRVYVYDSTNPSGGDTLTWLVQAGSASVNEVSWASQVSLFPNPAGENITLNIPSGTDDLRIEIYTHSGKLVSGLSNINVGDNRISLNDLAPGAYYLRIVSADGVVTKKFIRAH